MLRRAPFAASSDFAADKAFALNAAKGDAQTKLPQALTRPAHWTAE